MNILEASVLKWLHCFLSRFSEECGAKAHGIYRCKADHNGGVLRRCSEISGFQPLQSVAVHCFHFSGEFTY